MHRSLTLIVTAAALAYWCQSLWTLSSVIHGAAFLWVCAPAALGFIAILAATALRGIFSGREAARRRFSTCMAATLLVVIAAVYADVFAFRGIIFERLLEAFRLEVFINRRFPLTLAAAGAIVHPILFLAALGIERLLPPPQENQLDRPSK